MKINLKSDYSVLKSLLKIRSPSGEESTMKEFIIRYFQKGSENLSSWIIEDGFPIQDCVILRKGKPKVAFIAHMDTVGFTARYENQLLPIGSPEFGKGVWISGQDSLGIIECEVLQHDDGHLYHNFERPPERGTSFVFKPFYSETADYIQSPYLDNRAGIFITLLLSEYINNALLVYSCWEECGGGSIPYLSKIIYEKYKIDQVIIADVTWVTDGIFPGEGTVISLRDRYLPRRSYIDKIIAIASGYSDPFQIEVEGEGSSDGGEIQRSPYPINWCFIGPPVENTHSPREKVHKKDLISTLNMYRLLAENL